MVGFARPSTVTDRARVVVGGLVAYSMKLTGRYWEHNAPTVWPPPCTMHEIRDLVERELPARTLSRAAPESLRGRLVGADAAACDRKDNPHTTGLLRARPRAFRGPNKRVATARIRRARGVAGKLRLRCTT